MQKIVWNKIIANICVVLLCIFGVFGCSTKSRPSHLKTLPITAISIEAVTNNISRTLKFNVPYRASLVITAGQEIQFIATCTYANGLTGTCTDDPRVVFHSSDNSVAYFSSTIPGLLIALQGGEVSVSASAGSITSNTISGTVTGDVVARFAYVPFFGGPAYLVAKCDIDNLNVTNCMTSGATGYLPDIFATGIAFNGTRVYLLYNNSTPADVNVTLCDVNDADGAFSNCQVLDTGVVAFENPIDIAIHNNIAYITDAYPNNFVGSCPINSDGTFLSGSCQVATAAIPGPAGIGIKNYAYVTSGSQVYYCIISGASLTSCLDAQAPGLTSSFGIAFNGSKAYITDPSGGGVFVCNMNPDGTLTPCVNANLTGQTGVFQIAINNNIVFVTDFDGSQNINIITCNIGSDGTFNNCQTNLVGQPVMAQPPFGLGLY